MSRGRHDIGVRDRIEVPGEQLSSHQPSEVGHVDHERGSDVVGDLARVAKLGFRG